jgi:predicted MPP superfamily phosphohydrolase
VSLFLFTFFFLYAGMHVYAFLKAKTALAFGAGPGLALAAFMVVMLTSPFIVRLSERGGWESLARITAYVGYTWLGILFLFTAYAAAADIYRLFVHICGLALKRDLSHWALSTGQAFLLPLIFSLLTSVYGYFEARNIRTEKVIISTPKIPEEIGVLRIVQISDIHLGLIVREDRLERILEKVKAADPDILVSTGDLVDGQVCNLNHLSDLLRGITPRYGKYAVTGNHEFYAGLDNARCFTENAGFTLLRGETRSPGGLIDIAGVDDSVGKAFGITGEVSEKELLSTLPRDRFTLLLKHRPLVDRNSLGLFDLQLSGHVHRGQIFPFSIFTWLYYPIQSGFASLPHGSRLYVSRGAGTWGPPIRFLSPPEVAVIELVHRD